MQRHWEERISKLEDQLARLQELVVEARTTQYRCGTWRHAQRGRACRGVLTAHLNDAPSTVPAWRRRGKRR